MPRAECWDSIDTKESSLLCASDHWSRTRGLGPITSPKPDQRAGRDFPKEGTVRLGRADE